MQNYIKMCIIKKTTAKISSKYEDKKEHNTNRKNKKEGDLGKELEKMRNDIKEIKKAIIKKNKNWPEGNENTRDSQKGETEKGKEEEIQHKIQKESRTKANIIKQKKEQCEQEESQNKENANRDRDKDINRKYQNYNKKNKKKMGKSRKKEK